MQMNRCALYLVFDRGSGDVKIGISNNPDRRIQEIARHYKVKSVSVVDVTWFTQREQAAHFEREFHRRYRAKRSLLRGGREWFSLSSSEIEGFLQWMRYSTEQRTFRATTLLGSVLKSPQQLQSDRISAFIAGSVFSMLMGGALVGIITERPEAALAISVGGGALAVCNTKKKVPVSQTYDEAGDPVSQDLPIAQLKQMNLWEVAYVHLDNPLPPGGALPEKIRIRPREPHELPDAH
jgi:hypothetical protein